LQASQATPPATSLEVPINADVKESYANHGSAPAGEVGLIMSDLVIMDTSAEHMPNKSVAHRHALNLPVNLDWDQLQVCVTDKAERLLTKWPNRWNRSLKRSW
jgi:hypothetical protein